MSSTPVPVNITPAGAVPTPPTQLRDTLIDQVAAMSPGYTANLPGTLIEDISSTAVAAIAQIDQMRVDAINSIAPISANAFLLAQIGQMLGIPQGIGTNTSVYVVFSGTAGFVVPRGFIVSDGTYQYTTQAAAIIGSGGSSAPVFAVANLSGSWQVPPNTVTTISSSVPSPNTVTVTNPTAGISGTLPETVAQYRARVTKAVYATAQGTADYLATQLSAVPNVQPRLVSVQQASGGWRVICGGGDPQEVAGAIYSSVLDLSTIVGSSTPANNVTVSIIRPPNTYSVTYINPPAQNVEISMVWNTSAVNFTGAASVNQLGAAAVLAYVNSIPVGAPINLIQMTQAFTESAASVLDPQTIISAVISVKINGVATPPNAGTEIIPGDPESYFLLAPADISITQG